jgi:signal transduction histidine kinase
MLESEEIVEHKMVEMELEAAVMSLPKPKILLVDDVPANLVALNAILEDGDYTLVEAKSGAEALKCVLQDDFAVILMDVQMPEMSGYDAAKLIKKRKRSREIPIIFVTAVNKEDAYVVHGYQAGAIDYLFKPLDSGILKAKVEVFVQLYLAREQLRVQNEALRMQAELVAKHAELVTRTNELLEQSDRHKNEFLDVVSHELRTPLNFIMGFASVLVDEVQGPLNTTQQRSLEKILEGTERMLRLVNDLLDMAKLQAGKFQLDLQATEYAPLVAQVIDDLTPTAVSREVKLESDVHVHVAPYIDEQRLAQTLYNLVGNAIKFTPKGGSVRLKAYVKDAFLVTEVSDTGTGVSVEDIPKLFTRFKQLDMSKTRGAGGTGLGLYISKSFVESHGGTIGVDSELGKGSTFWFSLPLSNPALEESTP